MCSPNSGHHGEPTQYKTIQTKYVFKTSFYGHSGLFQMTLISHCLTSLLPKPTLILAKSLTSDPYNQGFLFRRKSVIKTFQMYLWWPLLTPGSPLGVMRYWEWSRPLPGNLKPFERKWRKLRTRSISWPPPPTPPPPAWLPCEAATCFEYLLM